MRQLGETRPVASLPAARLTSWHLVSHVEAVLELGAPTTNLHQCDIQHVLQF